MGTKEIEFSPAEENLTPSLSLEGLDELVETYSKKRQLLGVKKYKGGKPYWQPVRGIIRWELRQHYYENGKRKTRVLKTRKTKPRGKR